MRTPEGHDLIAGVAPTIGVRCDGGVTFEPSIAERRVLPTVVNADGAIIFLLKADMLGHGRHGAKERYE